jgi:hypothetical protein
MGTALLAALGGGVVGAAVELAGVPLVLVLVPLPPPQPPRNAPAIPTQIKAI